nr:MAG TPA: hypothetical protein [Siphoviridae sp. ctdzB12]DAL83306.1 MAG TPA: hypothetical protein [Caudoviricetes sp.]
MHISMRDVIGVYHKQSCTTGENKSVNAVQAR